MLSNGWMGGLMGRGLALAGLLFSFAGVPAAIAADSPVGSGNVAVADPEVPRPPGTPCVVQLFSGDTFDDFATRPFSYAPPGGCGGEGQHWSKVVLEADFSVTAGIQFDRTASIWLGGVNLYFGTTQEPGKTLAPTWHVERDLTDYSALLRAAYNADHGIDRAYESGEILSLPRHLIEDIYPPSACDPRVRIVRFNLLTGSPVEQHSMEGLTENLRLSAAMRGQPALSVRDTIKQEFIRLRIKRLRPDRHADNYILPLFT